MTNVSSAFPDQRVAEVAESLLGTPIHSVLRGGAGANSRIFRVDTAEGPFAIKFYPERLGDTRRRAEVEWRALNFMRKHGLTCVPEPIAKDARGQHVAMEWISGMPAVPHQPGDVGHAATFVTQIFVLSALPDAAQFSPASEACLSAAETVRQIERRQGELVAAPPLAAFIDREFMPALADAKDIVSGELWAESELEPEKRRLVPADFGFHNALREGNGALRYIDFDYFGWDDPAKLTADFLLHPAMQLSAGDRRRFLSSIVNALPKDADFIHRLRRHLPLYALRWAMILFNPFRIHAEPPANARDKDDFLANQIQTARAMIHQAQELLEEEPNWVHAAQ